MSEICVNPKDYSSLIELMDNYADLEYGLHGKNTLGEETYVEITNDFVYLKTYQHNGWIRLNYYYRDFSTEETFDGRWKENV